MEGKKEEMSEFTNLEEKKGRDLEFRLKEGRKKSIKFTNLKSRKEEISMKGRDIEFTNLEEGRKKEISNSE